MEIFNKIIIVKILNSNSIFKKRIKNKIEKLENLMVEKALNNNPYEHIIKRINTLKELMKWY